LTTAGEEIFEANLTQLRAIYNFNTRTFLRAIIQFRYTAHNPELYTDEVDRVSKDLFTQFLFSYKLNPQSVFFLGYSDNRQGFTAENHTSIPLTQADRTFFMKLSYAWRP
jgi:hypothetical protein